ncbi:MAG: hypothetical protein ACKOC1_01820 [Hyphomicrobiales bacterium]
MSSVRLFCSSQVVTLALFRGRSELVADFGDINPDVSVFRDPLPLQQEQQTVSHGPG